MSYALITDLTPSVIPSKTLIELTDDARSGAFDADIVNAELSKASGVVEMYCRQRYALPLQQTEELIGLVTSIAAYKLYTRRAGQVPDLVKQNNLDAMQMLRDISSNKASLDQPVPGANAQVAEGTIAVSRKRRAFSACNLKGFSGF